MALSPEPGGGRSDGRPVLDRLAELHSSAYQVAVHVLRGAGGADDVVQQAYLSAITHMPADLPPERLRSWFLKVVANAAKMQFRDEVRRKRRESAMTREETSQPGPELVQAVRRAVESLDDEHRMPVLLCYEQGLSQTEAGEVLGISQQTLSNRLAAGLETLRKSLAGVGYTAAPAAIVSGLVHTAPAVPASLAAAVQSIVAGGAATLGKAAAGAALKVSARLGAKKAAGLALGWKVAATVAVAAGLAGAGALVALKPEASRSQPVAAPVLLAPEVIYDDDFKSGKLDPFWATARHVETLPSGILRLSPPSAKDRAEIVSKDIELGGRPVEITLRRTGGSLAPWATPPGSPYKPLHAVELHSGTGMLLSVRRPESWTAERPNDYEMVVGTTKSAIQWPGLGFKVLIAPSGRVRYTSITSGGLAPPGMEPAPEVVNGSVGVEVKTVKLRVWTENGGEYFGGISVRRLEKWPDDAAAGRPGQEGKP